jgi:hypothetical protein
VHGALSLPLFPGSQKKTTKFPYLPDMFTFVALSGFFVVEEYPDSGFNPILMMILI